MKYKVRHINNVEPEDYIVEFDTEEESERFIEEGLNFCKENQCFLINIRKDFKSKFPLFSEDSVEE